MVQWLVPITVDRDEIEQETHHDYAGASYIWLAGECMMRIYHIKWLGQVVVLLILLLPLLLAFSYEKKQRLYILESNQLKSETHYSLSAAEQRAWRSQMLSSSPPAWLTAEIKQDDLVIKPVYANHWLKLDFPLYQGRLFSKNNGKEALVGAKVPTKTINGKDCFIFNHTSYTVIGRLGQEQESLLSKTVLLTDDTLLDQAPSLTFHSFYPIQKKRQQGYNQGVSRLLKLGSYLKLLKLTTHSVVALSLLAWFYCYHLSRITHRFLLYQLGLTKWQLALKELCRMTVMAIIASVLWLLLAYIVTGSWSLGHHLAVYLAAFVLISGLLAWYWIRREAV
ncbi:TPA: hypothetical protein TVS37_000970 [Streptococcus equi subsp. zooepidemicus]|nr:hypothetical protein [Streptococcus equi subsp. zooepidemicus]HEL0452732.1 hypothetical protein [Streptococcus equi subsp. zooepidemicus]HEL1334674.1 hypothetical protein [Streptococcus equi subsp. zooepidemicus]